jgi:DNA-binding transcriptional MocR family regulator
MPWTRVTATRLAHQLGELPGGMPAYQALAGRLRLLVAEGRLTEDTQLPSERDLALGLRLSRTTVTRAYGELVSTGYAVARRGSGTVVRVPGSTHGALGGAFADRGAGDGFVDLTCAAPAAVPGVHEAFLRATEQLPAQLRGTGYYPEGLPQLRARIAERYTRRGLATTPEQVVVTTGAQSSLAVVSRLLVRPAQLVLTESPTYPNAIETLRGAHARIVGHALGADGWHVPTLQTSLQRGGIRLALLMPDFQNPTGALMDDATRAHVAAVLARCGTTALVDESSAELALEDVVVPRPFGAHAPGTITVGSVSKALWGGFRVGWVRAPHELVPALVRARVTLDLGSSVVDQLAVTELFENLDAALADRRESLRLGRDAMAEAVRAHLPTWQFDLPAGGLSLWCRLPRRVAPAVVASAERHGVLLVPGGRFGVDGGLESHLRLPFTGDRERFDDAVQRIAAAYAEAPEQDARSSRRQPLIA